MFNELDHNDLVLDGRIAAIDAACATSRIYFCESVLGLSLEEWQYEALAQLDAGGTRLSIRSGNGVGKTFLCAVTSLHYLLFRSECKIVITSPSARQLEDGLYPEVVKWVKKLPLYLQDRLDVRKGRIVRTDNEDNAFISFRTSRRESPEALQGIHAKFVMCIVDEASGVPEEVYEAAQGTMSTPGAIFILIGNPTRLSGYFFNTHHKISNMWWTKKVTSFDTSNVDMSFVEMIEGTYGRTSDQWRVKVLGEFPSREENTLIPRDLIESAIGRDITIDYSRILWGFDPARGGDNCGFVSRSGNAILDCEEWEERDAMASVGRIKERWDRTPEKLRPAAIYTDSIGIGGPVADRLREMGLPAVDVNVSETSPLKKDFQRLRDSLWYSGKYWFESRSVVIAVPIDNKYRAKLVEEISMPFARFTSTGKNAVESKDEIKRRGFWSPNMGDAWMMTFMEEIALASGLQRSGGNSSWSKELEYDTPWVH